ncbi:receptor-like protein EIX1 [Abrus precatorius]|uniref:Receptor-like protein EIX1 n=1 Tax=Abrus precatorius TaxID=3816 RepID=A0A8B8LRT5_ABRPR|nr:receptor-like protein EIX1 [Abrus precatorius]
MITMLSSKISLFSLVTFLCICFYVGSSHANKCAETDRQALLKLKDGFIDERNSLDSWKGEDCCEWEGISCDNLTAHVTTLNLWDSWLRGKMDSSICELKHLTFFDISLNEVEGVIPKCIGSLAQLIELNLARNDLVGDIPPTLGNLSNLQTLDLHGNHLLANDLEWVSHLSTMKYLDLSHVNLSQSANWLSSISKIPSLLELRLDDCVISQVIPKSIPHINSSTSLKTLSLSQNQLNSSTLSLVLKASKVLTYLDLSYNSLQHNTPDGFVNMVSLSHLRYLNLSGNELEGNILKYIHTLIQLKELRLDQNKLSGKPVDYIRQFCSARYGLEVLYLGNNPFSSAPLPDFSCLSSLKALSLRGANIVGSLPQSVSKLVSLEELVLSNNSLNGTLPSIVWQLSSLRTLVLSSNELNGVDVIREAHLSNLSHLDLRDNQLSGSQPLFEISKLASLEELDLSDNQLNGTLPSTVWQLSSLRTLLLSSNKLNGVDVIRELHASNLSFLDLMNNQLSGSQPLLEISKLVSLEELYLSNNQLNGTFPSTIGQLCSLKRLYLNSNKFNGVVKESHLSNLSQLQYLNVAQNALAFNFNSNWVPPFQLDELAASSCILGPKFPTWLKQQRKLRYLQISNSGISDSFPNWFWNLPSRWLYLNVSHNKISGALPLLLPSTKGKYYNAWDFSFNNLSGPLPPFPELDALILSNNMFSGSITSFCATSPRRLTVLDLSSNLLSGTLSDCGRKFERLSVLNLAKNNLSGSIPKSFGTLQQIVSINLNSNNFSGEIPSLTFCTELRLIDFGKNNLQGTLPAWIGHNLRKLTVLSLEANKFHGNIPTSLCNLLYLQVLDLSENNITGKIPQ